MKKLFLIPIVALSLSACDVMQDSKAQIEEQYLAQHQELKDVVEQIRDQGLEAVQSSAAVGSVAACVTGKLEADPMGALVEVEGALQDSANLTELFATIEGLSDQEITLEQIPELLKQGADTVNYLRTLLEQYELAELQQQVVALVEEGQAKTQDVGSHLRQLIESCEA